MGTLLEFIISMKTSMSFGMNFKVVKVCTYESSFSSSIQSLFYVHTNIHDLSYPANSYVYAMLNSQQQVSYHHPATSVHVRRHQLRQ